MSKGIKKKINLKIIPGEAVLVASVDIMNHIIDTYTYMSKEASSKEEAMAWMDVANLVQEWLTNTEYSGEFNEEEEW